MLCENCNSEIRDEEQICSNCGNEVNRVSSFDSEEMLKANVFSKSISKFLVTKNNNVYDNRQKRIRKKKLILALFLMIVGVSLIIAGLSIKSKSFFYSNKGKRTVMIYMIGSDLESKYLAATKDIDEIISSSIDYKDVSILIYTGGSRKWHTKDIESDKQMLFEIKDGKLIKLEEFEDKDSMLDPENLAYLLNYGYKNYDSEYYDLILWDHGAGPIYGYGYDEYNKNDSMSLNDITNALKQSPFVGENKLELIGFDACLMSSIEVAYSLSSYANYMVASQEFEPGAGWDYKFLKDINSNTTTVNLGKAIIDYYDDYYKNKEYDKGISLSLLNLNKIDNVVIYANELFSKVDSDLVIDYSSISRTRSNSKSFGRISNEEYYYDLVDFNDLLSKMPDKYQNEVNSLKSSLSDLVIYQKTDLENTNGVSIFFPYENKKEISNNIEIYKTIEFSTSYNNFIDDFSEKLISPKTSTWDLSESEIKSFGEGEVSIVLPEDVIKEYSSASYVIFEKSSDGYFTPIFSGSDIKINGNLMSTTVEKKSIVVTDSFNNKMYITAIESVKGKDYTSYYIPALLTRFNVDTLKIETMSVFFDFIVNDDYPNGLISNVYPIDLNENNTYSKIDINLENWDQISFLSYDYIIIDEEGNYTKDWINSDRVRLLSFEKNEEINIEFSDLDIANEYYCLFKIKDDQNNTYYSNLVKVNKK